MVNSKRENESEEIPEEYLKSKSPLLNAKQAIIYTQILFSPKPVTAKSISERTKLPLNTVYYHLRIMNNRKMIDSNKNIIGNLVEESWYIAPDFLEAYNRNRWTNSVKNKNGLDALYTDPNQLNQSINFIQAASMQYLNQYHDNVDKFVEMQKNSATPALLKVWILNEEEFNYVVKEFTKIRLKLREFDKNKAEDIRDNTQFVTEDQKHLVFVGGLPDLTP